MLRVSRSTRFLIGALCGARASSSMHHYNSWLVPTLVQTAQRGFDLGGKTPSSTLVILNSPASSDLGGALVNLWDAGAFETVICADGGANRLYDALSFDEDKRGRFTPLFIKGDLDSLRPEVATFYESKGCELLRDPDQDNNDLEKCLALAVSVSSSEQPIVVYGAFGGRFDQQMSAFHSLALFRDKRIVLVGDGNLAFLLHGENVQHDIALVEGKEGPGCALIPLYGPCKEVTTEGLKWNLQGQALAFGQLVSTSNEVQGGSASVRVKTSNDLVWVCSVSL